METREILLAKHDALMGAANVYDLQPGREAFMPTVANELRNAAKRFFEQAAALPEQEPVYFGIDLASTPDRTVEFKGRPQASAPAEHYHHVEGTPPNPPTVTTHTGPASTKQYIYDASVLHTPAEQPSQELDALVAELETAGGDYRHLVLQARCRHAITDLRAQLAEEKKDYALMYELFTDANNETSTQAATITRLESEKLEMRELLDEAKRMLGTLEGTDLYSKIVSCLERVK